MAGENSGIPRAELARVIQGWELSGAVEVKASQVRHVSTQEFTLRRS